MADELWRLSAVEIASRIKRRETTASEVVDAHLERISVVNPAVNAINRVLDEDARAWAENADELTEYGSLAGPLHGVPITVKENIDMGGLPTTMGVPSLSRSFPMGDAPHLAMLRAAGAIPIGRTNLPDFALRWHTTNGVNGATLNPWDASLTPGGSSGGDAAALASGMTPMGLGNDIAGSLRWPSQCCGTVAIKPSTGRVARARMLENPPSRNLTSQLFAVHGPMARTVGDLRLMLAIMSGFSSFDPSWVPAPLKGPAPRKPIRVAVVDNPGDLGIDAKVADAVETAAGALRDAGYRTEYVEPPSIKRCLEVYYQLLGQLGGGLDAGLLCDDFLDYRASFVDAWREICGEPSPDPWAERFELAQAWSEFMAVTPLVLAPISTMPAWPAGFDKEGGESAMAWLKATAMIVVVNLFGLPATSIPTGAVDGVPQGVQVIAQKFREDLSLDAAEAIEARLGTFTPIDPVAAK
jgi:amidase